MGGNRTGIKNGEGLASRLRAFFSENPDEELTYLDIARKYGCSVRHAHHAVDTLTGPGEAIESVHVIRARAKGIAR